jgi:hypothetical protein
MLVYVQGSISTQEEEEHAGINTRLSSSSCSYRGNLQVACCCNWNSNLNAACNMRPLANHNTPYPNSMIMVNDSPLTPTRILVCLGSDPSPAWFGSGAGLVRIRMSVVRIPIPKSQSQAQAIGDGHKPDA